MSADLPTDLEEFDLTPEAIALLEFTSDTSQSRAAPTEAIYITSKDAFLWAGIAYAIAKSNVEALSSVAAAPAGVPAARRLEDIDILANLYEAVGKWRHDLQEAYRKLPQLQL